MIAIINREGNPLGKSKYELLINSDHIAFFEHDRKDGLAKCLKLASEAVEKAKWMDMEKLLDIGGG